MGKRPHGRPSSIPACGWGLQGYIFWMGSLIVWSSHTTPFTSAICPTSAAVLVSSQLQAPPFTLSHLPSPATSPLWLLVVEEVAPPHHHPPPPPPENPITPNLNISHPLSAPPLRSAPPPLVLCSRSLMSPPPHLRAGPSIMLHHCSWTSWMLDVTPHPLCLTD
jgi:hypothetical protein